MALQSPLLFRATVIRTRAVLSASTGNSLQHDMVLMHQMGILIPHMQVALSLPNGVNCELLLATTWMMLAEACTLYSPFNLEVDIDSRYSFFLGE